MERTDHIYFYADRLPRKAAGRAIVLGALIGCSMRGLQWSQERLRDQARTRAAEATAAEEVVEDMKEAAGQMGVQHDWPKSS